MNDENSLSPEDQEKLKRAMRRNIVIALILGLVLASLGFMAGKSMKEQRQEKAYVEQVVVIDVV